ncbi:NAD-dependent epimerase/dehydratase family protein [Yoonia sp. SDW83-1]|uniref:NAD-dependent epimerase/dehydratase family protein n=1 Tax=Yoonia sp. SDW83-1 TaxID=3366945 RepID=UPI00398C7033
MTVLVTGATGFLGSVLAAALHDQGADVIATGRNQSALDRLAARGIRTVPLDLAHPVPQCDADRIGPLDAVVHCAGLSSPWGSRAQFMAGNVDATRHIADLAERAGSARFVMISTGSVYFRFADQDRLAETQVLPPPVNHYALTKQLAEQDVLRRAPLSPVVIRPRGIYGAGDTALLPRLMRVAAKRPLPRFAQDGATDITHVDDVVAAIIKALEAGPDLSGQIINITGGGGIALPDIIEAACAATGVPLRWLRLPFGPVLSAARAMEAGAKLLPGRPEPPVTAYSLGILRYRQTLDIAKAATLLGWTPQVSFEDGLRRTFKDGAMRPGVI